MKRSNERKPRENVCRRPRPPLIKFRARWEVILRGSLPGKDINSEKNIKLSEGIHMLFLNHFIYVMASGKENVLNLEYLPGFEAPGRKHLAFQLCGFSALVSSLLDLCLPPC